MPGLYLAGPPSFESAAWAGLLCAGPGAVVGADAAAHLSGVLRDPPAEVVVWSAERQRVRHANAITQLCTAAGTGIESGLEWLFHKDVLTAHGLPLPRRQTVSEEGRIDCLYDDWSVIVELDGIRDHSDWSKDMFRDNAHALRLDAVTLRYGWTATTRHACAAAGQVAEALSARGWAGKPRRCRRCPSA